VQRDPWKSCADIAARAEPAPALELAWIVLLAELSGWPQVVISSRRRLGGAHSPVRPILLLAGRQLPQVEPRPVSTPDFVKHIERLPPRDFGADPPSDAGCGPQAERIVRPPLNWIRAPEPDVICPVRSSRHNAESGMPACQDGIDNDYDNLIDAADANCRKSTSALCLDNDGDGKVDTVGLDCYRCRLRAMGIRNDADRDLRLAHAGHVYGDGQRDQLVPHGERQSGGDGHGRAGEDLAAGDP
jgi:hypothetical protein